MEKVMSESEIKREYYESGNIKYESHFLNGKYHREDGPANIHYYDNGNLYYKFYYINGTYHRRYGPACVYYNHDGSVEAEYYYLDGKRHREDGPAIIEHYNAHNEYYWLNGEGLTKEEWYQRLNARQRVNLLYGKGGNEQR
jgi:antitoxin component YwqK of YwqJK toxin-antitoxin module